MTSLRILRSTFTYQYQLCSRSIATESTQAAFQPFKTAVRTPEKDPGKHTKEDIGKLYTMPDEVRKKLFPKYVLPLYFERLVDTFCETNIVVRQPAIELMDFLKRADYNHPIIRYVLYGVFGSGKTLTLTHALHYALVNDFVIVHVPSVWKWYHWSREVVTVEGDEITFDLPLDAAAWLKHFSQTNSELISKLDLKTSKTYEWTQREKTAEGSSLNELTLFGINRIKFACKVVDALLNELKVLASDKRCKVFAAIDGFNGFFQKSSRLKTAERVKFVPIDATLTKSFLNFLKNDWTNGAAVLVIDDHACVKGVYNSHFPFHLLEKAGIESIDPFIPIHVPNYSPLEFENYLDYLEEKRWLQKPDAREEIEFITLRNPRNITSYCAPR